MEGDEVSYKICSLPPKHEKIQAVEVTITHLAPGTKHETWSGAVVESWGPLLTLNCVIVMLKWVSVPLLEVFFFFFGGGGGGPEWLNAFKCCVTWRHNSEKNIKILHLFFPPLSFFGLRRGVCLKFSIIGFVVNNVEWTGVSYTYTNHLWIADWFEYF